jgi:glycosyltransferase involved in cell wall biosynthesis
MATCRGVDDAILAPCVPTEQRVFALSPNSGKLFYLCLQVTKEGQASHAHVWEILRGLEREGWSTSLFQPEYGTSHPSALRRATGFVATQLKLWHTFEGGEILYVRYHFATLPTILWAKLRKVPLVLEVNGPAQDLHIAWPWTRHLKGIFDWIRRISVRRSSAVIAVTENLASEILLQDQVAVHVVPNAANTEVFRPDVVSSPLCDQPYVVFFGALASWQGIDTLLTAVTCDSWPQGLILAIVGDGAERPKVEAAAKRNFLVRYFQSQPYVKMPGIIVASIAGLSPQTDCEGRAATGLSPLKVYETLACGVPVVVTDFPGQADLVKSERCGLVISPDSAKDLAQAVKYLHDHPHEAKSMGERGRKCVAESHSWEHRAKQTSSILKRLRGIS